MPVRGRNAGNAGKGSKWITPQRRQRIYARDGHRCVWCGKRGELGELTLDHVVPRSEGGSHESSNLITSCMKHNRERGNKGPLLFALELRRRAPLRILERVYAQAEATL